MKKSEEKCECCCHKRTHPCDVDTWDCEHCQPSSKTPQTEEWKEKLFQLCNSLGLGGKEPIILTDFSHTLLEKSIARERAYKEKQRREWSMGGYREGYKQALKEAADEITGSSPPRHEEWDDWSTTQQKGYLLGELTYQRFVLELLDKKKYGISKAKRDEDK